MSIIIYHLLPFARQLLNSHLIKFSGRFGITKVGNSILELSIILEPPIHQMIFHRTK